MFALVSFCLATLTAANQVTVALAARNAAKAAASSLPICDPATSTGWDYATLTCTCASGQIYQTWSTTAAAGHAQCVSLTDTAYLSYPLAATCPEVLESAASSTYYTTINPIVSCLSVDGGRIYFYPTTMITAVSK
jgi:hypothetical protein